MFEAKFIERIASDVGVGAAQAAKTVSLFEQGDTIPFLARYRKDVTGGLDEMQLEAIEERRQYFLNLSQRQTYVLETIARQGKLDEALRAAIEACFDRTALEDLYAPYKKRRHTKAADAREHGLTPLAEYIWKQEDAGKTPEEVAAAYVKPDSGIATPALALEGAQHILAEDLSLNAHARTTVRNCMLTDASITTVPTKKTEGQKTKYEAYYSFSEPVKSIPSHRFLAVRRGVSEGYLRMELAFDDKTLQEELTQQNLTAPETPFEPLIRSTVVDSYNRLLRPSIETEVIRMLHDRAENEAIHVFRANAESLLLAPPAGSIPVIGMDPGLRTGCKLAVVDGTGAFVESGVIYPNPPQNDIDGAKEVLKALIQRHRVRALAVGNGTGSRETSSFVRQALKELEHDAPLCVLVNESGASIYSASKAAREEFPELDVTVRGAISIARRLQDPLAELVKIEPRHVGVGQYQHDVNQRSLREGLHKTVVSCVNQVGVDLNTASIALLRYVSGLHANTAKSIVERRAKKGVYKDRQELLEVEGVGPKVFEQCAGFLRIAEAVNPLDRTAIHPESYPVVERMATAVGIPAIDLIHNETALQGLDLSVFQNETIGALAIHDIVEELLRPGRDPRKEFRVPKFLEGVTSVQELEESMELEGVVTNVTDFGAFVDIGVHQDGLIHLSELAHTYVKDPRDIVKVGDIVAVKVIKVDKELPRISLSRKALVPVSSPHRHSERRPHTKKDDAQAAPRTESPPAKQEERTSPRPRPKPQRSQKRAPAAKKPQRTSAPGPAKKTEGDDSRLNTQLAEQLAGLRKTLGR